MEVVTRPNLHPLQIPKVLEQIFSNLKFSDLQVCRLVCKLWLEESSRVLCPFGKVEVGLQKVERILHFFEKVKSKKRSYLQVPYYSKLSFLGIGPLESQLYRFFGDHIKSLEFHSIRFKTTDKFLQLLFEHCPKVEHLTLRNISISGKKSGPNSKSLQFSIRNVRTLKIDSATTSELEKYGVDILDQFPALEVLYANNNPGSDKDELFISLAALPPDSSKLKSISWCFGGVKEPEILLPLLGGGGHALEGIGLIFCMEQRVDIRREVKVTREIFGGQAATLQNLTISCGGQLGLDANRLLCLPNNRSFPKLENLHLQNLELRRMSFLDFTPNLKNLNLTFGMHQYLSKDIDSVYPNVKNLGVICSSKFRFWSYSDTLPHLSRVFPNIEKLNLDVSSGELVSLAINLWPNLKSFTVQSTFIVPDSGLTWYDMQDSKTVEQIECHKKDPEPELASVHISD